MRSSNINQRPEIISHHHSPDIQIRAEAQVVRAGSKRPGVTIILLIIVFTLGLINGFTVMNYDDGNMDPNRFTEVSHISVSGRVIDKETGNSLQGVRITMEGTNVSAATNQDGWFTIEQVQTGVQNVQAYKSEYKKSMKEIFLASDNLRLINFELEKGDGDLIEDSEVGTGDKSRSETKPFGAALFILFAVMTIPAIVLIYFRKNFWTASLFIIISMLSFGFIFGTVTAGVALVLMFTMKNDFDNRTWSSIFFARRRYRPSPGTASQPIRSTRQTSQTISPELHSIHDKFHRTGTLPPPPPPLPPKLVGKIHPPYKKQ